ncbi:Hypothetical predicted protein [Lynx pardinus]|uniref:L1 transposable element RRM domain-containing protein n=1 Tax=Lynx pardinus TaxID=191816 RepID=A0A485P8D5_LYNPA|nr:Hypothetical predicted protein [Lynx pardinus]
MVIPEDKKTGTENIYKAIMADHFPSLGREIDIQIHEAKRTPKRLKLTRATLRHIVNDKDYFLFRDGDILGKYVD